VSLVCFRPSEKKSHSGKTWDEILGALGFNLARARELSLERDPFSFKQEDFRSSYIL